MSLPSILRAAVPAAVLVLSACAAPSTSTPKDGGTPQDAGHPRDAGTPPPQVSLAVHEFAYPTLRAVTSPPWAVYQDGDGGWQALTGVDGGYTFPVQDPGGNYAVAVECASGDWVNIVLSTVSESPSLDLTCPIDAPPKASVAFQTSNWPANTTSGKVILGNGKTVYLASPETNVLATVQTGTQDVVALAETSGGWSRMVFKHNLGVQGGGVEVFDLGNGFSGYTFHVDTAGVTGADAVNGINESILTASRASLQLPTPDFTAHSVIAGPPASLLLTTDRLRVGTFLAQSGDALFRAHEVILAAPANVSLNPPPYLTTAVFNGQNTSLQRLPNFTWAGGPPSPGLLVEWDTQGVTYAVAVSPHRVGNSTQFTLPDLSSAPGFDSGLLIDPGSGIYGLAFLTHYNGPPEALLNALLANDTFQLVAGQELSYSGAQH